MRCPHCDGTGLIGRDFFAMADFSPGACPHCDARGYILHGAQLQAARWDLWKAVGWLLGAVGRMHTDPGIAAGYLELAEQHADEALRIIGEEPGRFG